MRESAGPTTASKTQLKRIARYLKGRQRCVLNSPWVGKLDDVIHVTVDADWAGDPKTKCSASGGVLAIGPCFTVRHWSVTQATVSLSSAELEAKAITKGTWNTCWNTRGDQKLAAIERLLVFDDGENESLEDDVHSFVDKTSHLTTAVLRRGVEMNIL